MTTESKSSAISKVFWLTNVATPYRIPMWQWLGTSIDITLGMLRDPEASRFGAWTKKEIGVDTEFFHAPTLTIGTRAIYFPNRAMRKMLKQDWDYFVLGGWESPAYFYALMVARKRGIKVIGHCGSTAQSSGYAGSVVSKLRAWFHQKLDWSVTYGTDCTQYLIGMGVDPTRIYTGFNSVDHVHFYNGVNENREEQAQTFGHNYLYVGQFITRKNVANLIRAFKEIRQSGDTLRLAGRGDLQSELEALTSELGLADSVAFIGHRSQDELIIEYCLANTLILPSFIEVWGLAVNEALTCGLNVVVSDKCGIANDIKHMQGVYVSGCEIESIGQKMAESRGNWSGVRSNPEILQFTIEKYGQHFLNAMQELR